MKDIIQIILAILVVAIILTSINNRFKRKHHISAEQQAETRKWAITWICGIIGVACAFTVILIPVTYAMGAIIKQAWRQDK